MFIICELRGSTEGADVLVYYGAMHTDLVMEGQYWRLFTAMFLHSGIRHLLNNMILLGALGSALERTLGSWKYGLVYLGGGLLANAISCQFYIHNGETVIAVGASGCVYAVMGGLIAVVIRSGGRAAGFSIRQMILLAALSLYFGFAGANVANSAHVAGLICGFLLGLILYTKKGRRMRRNVV